MIKTYHFIKYWIGFAALASIVFIGLFFITKLVLASEAAETEARRIAAVSQDLRVALWRLDTALSPLISQESLIPIDSFLTTPILNSSVASDTIQQDVSNDTFFPISELPIVDRFDWSEETGQLKTTSMLPPEAHEHLQSLVNVAKQGPGWLRRFKSIASTTQSDRYLKNESDPSTQQNAQTFPNANDALQMFNTSASNEIDYQQRRQNSELGNYLAIENKYQSETPPPKNQSMAPLWHESKLLLVRSFGETGALRIQGCEIDTEKLEPKIKQLISDLFPELVIVPVGLSTDDAAPIQEDFARLATLPLRLEPTLAPSQNVPLELRPSTWYTLLAAWGASLLAALAAGLSLAAFQRINHRRTLFVSSVTHELRTPLTTFQLYTDLLTQGFVTDESRRKSYLETLKSEAFRLQHLVANILAFSRIERGRASPETSVCSLCEMIAATTSRAQNAAHRGEMTVEWQCEDHADQYVLCNLDLFEQILLNLVDNSCKYASRAVDRRIVIQSSIVNKRLHLSIQDFGPGFSSSTRWWQPFSKSAEQAAESAPGIGLGLALSKSLARQFSAELSIDSSQAGAKVTLSLKIVPQGMIDTNPT
ncbi:MAG: sensor histidine kinase [Pirellula sp.]|jgi:signal transduction histidine kinase